jgi:hypothetical protein
MASDHDRDTFRFLSVRDPIHNHSTSRTAKAVSTAENSGGLGSYAICRSRGVFQIFAARNCEGADRASSTDPVSARRRFAPDVVGARVYKGVALRHLDDSAAARFCVGAKHSRNEAKSFHNRNRLLC